MALRLGQFGRGRFVALEWDSSQLRMAWAERAGGGVRVRQLAAADVPAEVALDDAEAMGRLVSAALAEHGRKGRGVVMCVPRGQAVLKTFELPGNVTGDELPEMVRFQVEKELPFAAAEAVIDFNVEPHVGSEPQAPDEAPGGERTPVLAAAVRVPALAYYRAVARAARVKLLRVGLRPYADYCCLRSCGAVAAQADAADEHAEAADGVALVHLTADETEIDVLERGALAFSRSAVVDLSPPRLAGERGAEAARAAVVAEVARTLQSYQAIGAGHGLRQVLVAGGTGLERKVSFALAGRLGLPTDVFEPGAALGLDEDQTAAPFVSVVGLALAHGGREAFRFDFLNPRRARPRRDPARRRRRLVAAAAVTTVVFAAALGWLHLHGKQVRKDALLATYSELRARQGAFDDALERRDALVAWLNEPTDWLAHLAHLTATLPGAQEMYVASGFQTRADGVVELTLRARSQDVLQEVGERLREAGYVYDPESVPSGDDDWGYPAVVKAEIRPTPRVKLEAAGEPPARPVDDESARRFGLGGRR